MSPAISVMAASSRSGICLVTPKHGVAAPGQATAHTMAKRGKLGRTASTVVESCAHPDTRGKAGGIRIERVALEFVDRERRITRESVRVFSLVGKHQLRSLSFLQYRRTEATVRIQNLAKVKL